MTCGKSSRSVVCHLLPEHFQEADITDLNNISLLLRPLHDDPVACSHRNIGVSVKRNIGLGNAD